jgi:hypothetical protein
MNEIIRNASWLALALFILTAFSSCEHKELCYGHPTSVKVRVNVDWSEYDGELPEGMTVAFYPADGGNPTTVLTNDISHADAYLKPGTYHVGVICYSIHEYGTILFENVYNHQTISITPAELTSDWYVPEGRQETIVCEPEDFGTDYQYDVVVPGIASLSNNDEALLIATLVPENVITTLDIEVDVVGLRYFKSAKAALTNLAQNLLLGSKSTNEEKATHLIETWTATPDSSDANKGTLSASIKTLGLPQDHDGHPDFNNLKLLISLIDNKTTIDCQISAGDKFTEVGARRLLLKISEAIALPEVTSSSGSGFDVSVEEWPDDDNTNIDI